MTSTELYLLEIFVLVQTQILSISKISNCFSIYKCIHNISSGYLSILKSGTHSLSTKYQEGMVTPTHPFGNSGMQIKPC